MKIAHFFCHQDLGLIVVVAQNRETEDACDEPGSLASVCPRLPVQVLGHFRGVSRTFRACTGQAFLG